MDTKIFWEMIENTKANISLVDDEDYMAFQIEIVNNLADMEIPEMMKWQQIFNEYQKLSYKEKLWDAAIGFLLIK